MRKKGMGKRWIAGRSVAPRPGLELTHIPVWLGRLPGGGR